jgi:hypothetical protein
MAIYFMLCYLVRCHLESYYKQRRWRYRHSFNICSQIFIEAQVELYCFLWEWIDIITLVMIGVYIVHSRNMSNIVRPEKDVRHAWISYGILR